MSNIIIYDKDQEIGCFACNTMDIAYGHLMYGSLEMIEAFEKSIPKDARSYEMPKLSRLWGEFQAEHCPMCLCASINTNGGDCYCAECGHKWTV